MQKLHQDRPAEAQRALDELCKIYWRPLYAFARGDGRSHEDAEDAVQGFLARGMEQDLFSMADESRGRMRSFLLTSFRRYMRDIWLKGQAEKRGGSAEVVAFSPKDEKLTGDDYPVVEYDRSWAVQVVETAGSTLRDRYVDEGKAELFDILAPALENALESSYAEVAGQLNMSEASVKVAVHRLRRRFADSLSREVGQTLAEGEDVDAEIRYLFQVLGGIS